jgi:hypothetical protein
VLGSFSSKWGKLKKWVGGAISVKMSLLPALLGKSSSAPPHSCTHTKSAGRLMVK